MKRRESLPTTRPVSPSTPGPVENTDVGPAEADRARGTLLAFAFALTLLLYPALTKDPNPPFVPPPGATTDLDFYERISGCVREGESYYDASQRELRAHGYPTRSVFNWRPPTLTWLSGRLPGLDWLRSVLVLVVLFAVALTSLDLLRDVRLIPAGVGAVAFVGATAWVFGPKTFLFHEVWAGALITLSLGLLRRNWVRSGVAVGVAALFVRELALPYVLVCLALAWYEGRRREMRAWMLGLAVFAPFMIAHALAVLSRLNDLDHAMPKGWVRFGGARFVLVTSQSNVFLMALPLWCTAVYTALSGLGFWYWCRENGEGRRTGLTAAAYLAAFSVVGAPFNFYWGFVDAPLLAIGFAHAPGALAGLVETAVLRSNVNRGICPVRGGAVS